MHTNLGTARSPTPLVVYLGCETLKTGVVGLMEGVTKADCGLEINQLEQRAWVRLGELIAFDGMSRSFLAE